MIVYVLVNPECAEWSDKHIIGVWDTPRPGYDKLIEYSHTGYRLEKWDAVKGEFLDAWDAYELKYSQNTKERLQELLEPDEMEDET